jgi:bacitracin synthase 3
MKSETKEGIKTFIRRIQAQGIRIEVDSIGLKVEAPKGRVSEKILTELKERKEELLTYFQQVNEGHPTIKPLKESHSGYAISHAQKRLWIISQFEEGNIAYNMPFHVELDGAYDIELFKRAVYAAIQRHEILRTVFLENEEGEIRQWVKQVDELGFSIDYRDYRRTENPLSAAMHYVSADSYRAFSLSEGPLLRASLLQVANDRYVFYYNMHHIISDAWSMGILARDVLAFYEAYKEGKEVMLPELHIQYKDYSTWQLEQIDSGTFEEDKMYWQEKFQEEIPVLAFPTTKKRPPIRTNAGRTLGTYLNKDLSNGLKAYSRQQGGRLFMGLIASLTALLHRYTGQEDIILGSPIAGRDHADLEDQIGFYINTLALRNKVKASDSFNDLFARTRETILSAYQHQRYPFDELIEGLKLRRDPGRNVLFDVLVDFHPEKKESQAADLSQDMLESIVDLGESPGKFDMEINFQEEGECIVFMLQYNPDLYEEHGMRSFMQHFKEFLSALLKQPTREIEVLNYLTKSEKEELLGLNQSKVTYPEGKTFLDIFKETARTYPNKNALEFKGEVLTYKNLDLLSDSMAIDLIEMGVEKGDRVALSMGRGIDYLLAMLSALKAGACFIPINPDSAVERNKVIVNEADPQLFLTSKNDEVKSKAFIDGSRQLLLVDHQNYQPKKIQEIQRKVEASDLAYIIFTSGSTGKPKGAMVEHKGMLNHLLAKKKDFNITSETVIGQNATQTFDVSVWQYLVAFVSGGTTVVMVDEEAWEPEAMFNLAVKSKINILESVPSHLLIMLDYLSASDEKVDLGGLKYLVMNGEALPVESCREWFALYPNIPMANVYGPTECSDDITHFFFDRVSEQWQSYVPIGKPIQNMNLYILDDNLQLLPKGSKGQLYASGIGVGRGYFNNESQTKKSFLENPFKKEDGYEVLYKTGDVVQVNKNGEVEFLGRVDHQVKIRGNRVELGEIEAVLQKDERISGAKVIARESAAGETELLAYIVAKEKLNQEELQQVLYKKLPDYMHPAQLIQLEEFPLSSNGKIDSKLLPVPGNTETQKEKAYIAPRNEVESTLATIWEGILKKEKVGIYDNFFELGGHSLNAIQMIHKLNKELGVRISIQNIFETPTVADIGLEINLLLKNYELENEELIEINL